MEGSSVYSREELAGLYRRHIGMVYQICLVMLKNVPDAEDAAHNVFCRAMAQPFRDPEHEKAWLITAARNECRNQLKHWWRTRRAGPEVLETLTWEQPEDGSLWENILTLPKPWRLALYLHYYQGYTEGETARLMGKNPSTVRSWLARARRKLKTLLEAEEHGT